MTSTRNSVSGKRPSANQPPRKKLPRTGGRDGRPDQRRPSPVSRTGLTLMAVTGLVGLGLAVHGWSARTSTVAGPLIAGGASASAAATPAGSASPQASSSGNGSSNGSSPAPSPSASTSVGPLLSSQSYAQYAYQVWPGTPSSTAKTAMTGLSISVTRKGNGIEVTAGVAGQQSGPATFYAGGAKVYIIEAALGDDSGNLDYSLGDDGLVVVNAAGRILQ